MVSLTLSPVPSRRSTKPLPYLAWRTRWLMRIPDLLPELDLLPEEAGAEDDELSSSGLQAPGSVLSLGTEPVFHFGRMPDAVDIATFGTRAYGRFRFRKIY